MSGIDLLISGWENEQISQNVFKRNCRVSQPPSQRKSQLLRFYYGLGLLPSCSCWNNFVLARLTAERRRHYYKAKQASSPTIRRAANKPVNSWVRLFNALHLEVNGLCASSRNVSINPSLGRSCVACSATGDRCGSKQEVISRTDGCF